MTAWQPKETAPRDGTPILVYGPELNVDEAGCAVVEFRQRSDGTAFWEVCHLPYLKLALLNEVTHWMPLPEPPEGKK